MSTSAARGATRTRSGPTDRACACALRGTTARIGRTRSAGASPLDSGGAAIGGDDGSAVRCEGNNVFAAWIDDRSGGGNDVYFNVSTDGGNTWSADDVKLNTSDRASSGLSLDAYGDEV